jgi:hypothetical protein
MTKIFNFKRVLKKSKLQFDKSNIIFNQIIY